MGEGSRVEVKNNYYLFMDGSSSSKEVEKRLRDVGIDFIRVQERGGVLPRLTGPEGVFQGTTSILSYFTTRSHEPESDTT